MDHVEERPLFASSMLQAARKHLKKHRWAHEWGVKFRNRFFDLDQNCPCVVSCDVSAYSFIHVLVKTDALGYYFRLNEQTLRTRHTDELDAYMATAANGCEWIIIKRKGTRRNAESYEFTNGDFQFVFVSEN